MWTTGREMWIFSGISSDFMRFLVGQSWIHLTSRMLQGDFFILQMPVVLERTSRCESVTKNHQTWGFFLGFDHALVGVVRVHPWTFFWIKDRHFFRHPIGGAWRLLVN